MNLNHITPIVLVIFQLVYSDIYGQQVSGTVTFNKIPLRNVVIKSVKTGNSAQTDSAGMYHINSAPDDILVFTAAGFKERKIKVGQKTVIDTDLKYLYSETSFRDAVENKHISAITLRRTLDKYPPRGEKDYSKYQNIYELIRSEIPNVRVVGTSVYSVQALSFSLSSQVLYVVDETIMTDISYISPVSVKKIVYLEGVSASEYGMRGANGVIKITLKK